MISRLANADGDDGVGFKGEIIAVEFYLTNCDLKSLLIVGVVAFYCYVLRTSHDCLLCARVNLPDIVSWSLCPHWIFSYQSSLTVQRWHVPIIAAIVITFPVVRQLLPLPLLLVGVFPTRCN